MEIVGQKHIVLTGVRVPVADTSQRNWASGRFGAGKEDALIASQALALEDVAAFDNTVTGIAVFVW